MRTHVVNVRSKLQWGFGMHTTLRTKTVNAYMMSWSSPAIGSRWTSTLCASFAVAMPNMRRYEDGFVVRHQVDLPDIWQGPDSGFLAAASLQLGRPVEHLTEEVIFELPECYLSRAYQQWLDTHARRDATAVGVAITNLDDFAAANGPGAVTAALRSLQVDGFPCHYLRICIVRSFPVGY